MSLIPGIAIQYFENMIYLPMIISILERNQKVIEISSLKLKGLYINIVETTLNAVKSDLKTTKVYKAYKQ